MTDYKLTHATDYRSDIDDLLKWLNKIRKHYASATAPTVPAPEEGQPWWDSDNNVLYIYDGSDWVVTIGTCHWTIQSGCRLYFDG